MSREAVQLDFSKAQATDVLLPNPAALPAPDGTTSILNHRQPTFDTQHQSVASAQGLCRPGEQPSQGERWLDGKLSREA